jgi:toxin ParE1/3/4
MNVIVSPAARDDIREAYNYFTERDSAIAGRLVRAISDAIDGLTVYPLLGRAGVVPGTRERILTRFPYKIVYEINANTIEIYRVLHMARQWP